MIDPSLVAKFRKKPVVIEAMQLPAEDVDPSSEWIDAMHDFIGNTDWQSEPVSR